MKTNKKILLILTSLGIILGISSGLSLFGLFGMTFGQGVAAYSALQIVAHGLYTRYGEYSALKQIADEWKAKPYKEYEIKLDCQHCGKGQYINVDLTNTEFECPNCKKKNGLHVNFSTTAIMDFN